MFSNGFPKEWSTLRKLAWLYRTVINAVSAVLKTVTGNPIHITDALAKPAQALSVKLEPIQDLNGYDNPWPAGGGVNKLPTLSAYDSTYNGIRIQIDNEGKVRLSGTSTELVYITFDIPEITLPSTDIYIHMMNSVANSAVGIFFLFDNTSIAGLTAGALNRIYKSDALTGATINKVRYYVSSGQTVDMTLSPMLCLDGTAKAFSPYSNICPISGHTDADVTRTGRNLLDTKNYAPSGTTSSGITIVQNQDGSFKVSGTATGVVNLWLRGAWGGTNPVLKLYAGKTYFIKDCTLYNGKSMIGSAVNMGQTGTYTPSADIEVTGVRASTPNGTTLDTTIYPYVTDSADTEWQPFGDTYSITFPSEAGTVYGGTLDVTQGKLTVDRAILTCAGIEGWIVSSGATNRFTYRNPTLGASSNYSTFKSNYLKTSEWGNSSFTFAVRTSGNVFVMLDGNAPRMTADDFKAYLASNPLQFCYELATPITIQLTPTQVELLQGENNIWSDGEMTLVYLADGNASDVEALNILLGGRYVNNHAADEPTDREALDIVLGGNK